MAMAIIDSVDFGFKKVGTRQSRKYWTRVKVISSDTKILNYKENV
jgi:hypothetical protein